MNLRLMVYNNFIDKRRYSLLQYRQLLNKITIKSFAFFYCTNRMVIFLQRSLKNYEKCIPCIICDEYERA